MGTFYIKVPNNVNTNSKKFKHYEIGKKGMALLEEMIKKKTKYKMK